MQHVDHLDHATCQKHEYAEDLSSRRDHGDALALHKSMPEDAPQNREHSSHAAQAFMAHALAGAAAGMAETAVMYPIDTIKTRVQVVSWLALYTSLYILGLCVMHLPGTIDLPLDLQLTLHKYDANMRIFDCRRGTE